MITDIKLKAEMFGGFSISNGDAVIGDNGGRSPKIWNILAYFITYRHREIPQSELIDLLWGDDELNDPMGALKTLVYRARAALDELGVEGKKLILCRRGAYYWNNDAASVEVDAEVFERLLHRAERTDNKSDRLDYLLRAAELYKGEFLSDLSSESWVITLSAFYSSKFITGVNAAVELLDAAKCYDEIIQLCKKVVALYPYDESTNAMFIRALTKMGNYRLALNHYSQVTEILQQQFGVAPSDEFFGLYKEIAENLDIQESSIGDITTRIKEDNPKSGAYYCDPLVFREICRYDSRTKLRSGGVAFLGLLTIRDDDETPGQEVLQSVAKPMNYTIRESLRSGDCFTQLSPSQFALLLQNTTYEKGLMVLRRVIRNFQKSNTVPSIIITNSLEQLEPMQAE